MLFSKILKKIRDGLEIRNSKGQVINQTPSTGSSVKSPILFAGEAIFDPVASENDIFYCFRLILGRFPNREEWKGHSSFVGKDLAKVVAPYINSSEFANRKILAPPTMDDIQLVKLDRFSMYLSPSDYAVGLTILTSKTYEPNVTRVLIHILKPGMTVLDVGANIGYFSLLMSTLVGKEGRCIAIEPNPHNIKLLLASKKLNGFTQLQILQAAAGDTWGILHLNTIYSNGVVSPVNGDINEIFQRETVLSLKIDDILPRDVRVDVIKIDVEGAEFNALSGVLRCIERDRPIIISEFMPGALQGISGITPEEYLNFIINHGYYLSVLEADHVVPCQNDIEMVMKEYREKGEDHIDILAEPLK